MQLPDLSAISMPLGITRGNCLVPQLSCPVLLRDSKGKAMSTLRLSLSLPLSVPRPRLSVFQYRGLHSCCFSAFSRFYYPSCYPGEKLQRGYQYQRPQLSLKMEQFWTSGSMGKNKALVEHLREYGVLRSDSVAEVMETIDRALFVPKDNPPYMDSPMPIDYNATISAPHMHAMCLELLKNYLQPGARALDVGSGSGYLTACFAMLVGPEGRAVGVEHIPELIAASIENVKRSAAASLLEKGSLSLHVADGRYGWPEEAPYDCIHVGAAAPEIPKALLDQLKPGGRIVIPVGHIFQDLQVVDKKLDGSIMSRTETGVRYVPLTSRSAQLQNY